MKIKIFSYWLFSVLIALFISQTAAAQSYTISPNGYICSSTTSATLSGSQTGYYYQFATMNSSGNGTYYSNWISGTGSSITWSSVPATGTCVVYGIHSSSMPTQNGIGNVMASGAIFYQSPPVISLTVSGNTSIKPGQSVTLTANIAPTSTVTGAWNYMWFNSGRPIQNANGATYTATAGGSYTCDITGNCSGQMTSAITVTQIMDPGTISPAAQKVNKNVAGGLITGSLPAVWSGTYTYQWQSSGDGVTWSNIGTNGTSQNYQPTAQPATVYYRREVINGTTIGYSNVSAAVVGYDELLNANLSIGMNYILTSTPLIAGLTANANLQNQTTAKVKQSIQYFDGLGREIQVVEIKASPQFNDIVHAESYDNRGRAAVSYLPYTSTVNDGSYKTTALADQSTYYGIPPSGSGVTASTAPYAVIGFEASPINRAIEQGAVGQAWQISGPASSTNTDHTARISYTTNDQTSTFSSSYTPGSANPGSRIVALYTVSNNVLTRTNGSATYTQGQLSATIIRDENWQPSDGCIGTTEEYKDNEGHVV